MKEKGFIFLSVEKLPKLKCTNLGQLFLHGVVNWLPSSQHLRTDWATCLQRCCVTLVA